MCPDSAGGTVWGYRTGHMIGRESLLQALREPLAHFLIAGLIIFLIYSQTDRAVDVGDRRIVVTETQVKRLASMWAQTWQRAPRPDELDGLIRDFIKEEVYYREALRLGLDQDDVIVRKRMRAKMEAIASAAVESIAPSDAELQALLDRYPAKYASDPLYSFEQLYFSTTGGEAAATRRARAVLVKLNRATVPTGLGDPLALPDRLEGVSRFEISRQFGDDFTAALATQPIGLWAGPVTSGFGLHLVRVNDVTLSKPARLADVRQAVENDWRNATRTRREANAYQSLLDSYQIEIAKPR